MGNYATLKAAIQSVIKTNGNEEITGALLQQSLLTMINSLGADFQFVGVALPSTTPGTPDHNVAYIAGAGSYPNFNNAYVPNGYVGIFTYNGAWVTQTLQVGKNYDAVLSGTPKPNYWLTTGLSYVLAEQSLLSKNNGTIISISSHNTTDYIPVVPGDRILYNGKIGANTSGANIVGYASNNDFVAALLAQPDTLQNRVVITIPDNVYYIRASFRADSSVIPLLSKYDNGSFDNILDYFSSNISNAFAKLVKLGVKTTITPVWSVGYYTMNGSVVENTDWKHTEIDVENISLVKCKLFTTAAGLGYVLQCDKNHGIINRLNLLQNTEYNFVIDKRCKYLLLSNRTAGGNAVVSTYDISNLPVDISGTINSLALGLSSGMDYSPLTVNWTVGAYYNSAGSLVNQANFAHAELDVENYRGREIQIDVNSAATGLVYSHFFDANNGIVLSIQMNAAHYVNSFIVPNTAKYLGVSNRSASGSGYVNLKSFDYLKPASALASRMIPQLGKVSIIGDSITYGVGASDSSKRFSTILCGYLGATENNLGVAGSCLADSTGHEANTRFVARATAQNLSGSDLIIVFGGTNDFTYDSRAIGDLFTETTITPTGYIGNKQLGPIADVNTFAGAVHELINTIRQNAPNIPILFVTPLNRGNYNENSPSSKQTNRYGNFLKDFVNAIETICAFYSIPVCNMSVSELDFSDSTIANQYSIDSLHPNNDGHKIIADVIYKYIISNLGI